MKGPQKTRKEGFTLVEIVIALGVIAFAVVALAGLMSISLGSSRESNDDTAIASMARQITDELQARPFNALVVGETVHYFDHEARQLGDENGATYRCKATLSADSDYLGADASGQTTSNLYRLRLEFSSGPPEHPALLATMHTAIARYE